MSKGQRKSDIEFKDLDRISLVGEGWNLGVGTGCDEVVSVRV